MPRDDINHMATLLRWGWGEGRGERAELSKKKIPEDLYTYHAPSDFLD